MRSTFAGFTTAQLAMRASQKALDITGQNIANINTAGYTRQRLDLISLNSSTGVNKYESQFNAKVGNGVLIKGMSQIRDPFLDVRYRTELANVGTSDQKLAVLKDLELIFDEITKTGTQEQLSEITSMLQKLSSEVGNKEFDSMVKSSSDVFTKLLNQYANQLNGIRKEQETNLDIDVTKVNDILENIQKLNETIETNHIHGNPALELQDQRNLLIDELSSYMKIEVRTNKVELSESSTIERLNIYFTGTAGNVPLVKGGEFASKISTEKDVNGKINMSFSRQDIDVDRTNNLLTKIDDLNEQIKVLKANGNSTKDVELQREYALDELEKTMYVKISRNGTDITGIDFAGTSPATPLFRSGTFVSTMTKQADGSVTATNIPPAADVTMPSGNRLMNDEFLQGSFKGMLDMLNKSGEFDNANETTKGIGYYEKSLDLLANQFAKSFNDMNREPVFDKDGNQITGIVIDAGADTVTVTKKDKKTGALSTSTLTPSTTAVDKFDKDGKAVTTLAADEVYIKKDLFTTSDGSTEITASNIAISQDWKSGTIGITASVKYGSPVGSNDNILNLISMMSEKQDYKTPGGVQLFNGSFQEMYTNMSTTLALDIKSTSAILDNFVTVAEDIANMKDNISAVSLDEEGMNILHYQKSYNAAARLMTALDEAIDTVINKMGVVGR